MSESKRRMLGKHAARVLLFDLSPPLTSDIGEDVCTALENTFSLVCNMTGPARIPFFSLLSLAGQHEVLLPYSYVRNNFARIQTAIADVNAQMCDSAGLLDGLSPSFYLALDDACTQFRRQLQSNLQSGSLCEQLEVVIVTCQGEKLVQRQIETALATLDTEHIKRIQIVCLVCEDLLQLDELCISQSSSVSQQSNCSSSGLVELVTLQPEPLILQNFFNQWLVDTATDSEHMHIMLPSLSDPALPVVIKCDLHERLIQPLQLPFFQQFTLHSDSSIMKAVFPTAGKAILASIPVFHLEVVAQVPVTAVCDSIVFGVPLIAQATTCWKIDWDDLDRNQHMFKALCHTLSMQGNTLIAKLLPSEPVSSKSSKTGSPSALQPYGHFVLAPSSTGTLLVKALATQEIMLPFSAGNQSEEVSVECQEAVLECLEQVDQLEEYNPLLHSSHLFDSLKGLNKKSSTQWHQKRTMAQTPGSAPKKACSKPARQVKQKAQVVDIPAAPEEDTSNLFHRVTNRLGHKSQRRALYTDPHTMFSAQRCSDTQSGV